MGNALVELESQFPFNFTQGSAKVDAGSSPLFGIGRTLYFCMPPNEKLLGHWDIVEDRLFKIRHCMDIDGVVRPLALFDPPLDPGLLVKATASGLDVGSIVNALHQPIGPVRCQILIQKALEIAGEVRSLGSTLLSALEKRDAERLSLLRQRHELAMLERTKDLKFLQWRQAQASTDTLLRTRESALLGEEPDTTTAPETLPLDRRELTEESFDDAYQALVAQYDQPIATKAFGPLALAGASSPSNQSGATGAGSLFLNINEDAELNQHLPTARDTRLAASTLHAVAGVLTLIPEIGAKLAFWGVGADAVLFGGSKLSDAVKVRPKCCRRRRRGSWTRRGWQHEPRAISAASTSGSFRRIWPRAS